MAEEDFREFMIKELKRQREKMEKVGERVNHML